MQNAFILLAAIALGVFFSIKRFQHRYLPQRVRHAMDAHQKSE